MREYMLRLVSINNKSAWIAGNREINNLGHIRIGLGFEY